MTTDAKIGLLLGLVFIVIIAFVINGLPSFTHKSQSSNELTNKYVTQVGKESVGLVNAQHPSIEPTNTETNAVSNNIGNVAANTTAQGQNSVTQVNSIIETKIPVKETEIAVGNPKPEQSELMPSEETKTQADVAVAQAESEKAQTASEQKSTTYVVKKGDNLGLIAQNCYGTQGAKRENVTKIVKANHLKSEGQIYIGQKLTIPNPIALAETQPAMFEKVKNAGKTPTTSETTKESSSSEKGVRDYVVKSGDYPWKIAAKELGSGTRFKEVLKCNPNINEKTTLSVGMHLKLPAK